MNKSKSILNNMIWRFAERSGAQGVQFIVSIVLARLLSPSDYGIVGLTVVFIAISTVFIDSGFGQALVQKREVDNIDFSSVFFLNISISILLYLILFFISPLIADFYKEPILSPVLRILSLTLIIGAVNSVQYAYVQKAMQFKRYFFSTIIGTIVSAAAGITLAYYYKFGVWALVTQQLSAQTVSMIVLWFTLKWRPSIKISISKLKGMFSFGWKLLCSSLLSEVYNNIYPLVIGRFYSTQDIGFYNRGSQFPHTIISNINNSISSVIFPHMSEYQLDKVMLKDITRRTITTSTFIIFPLMAGLAVVAKPLVNVLLTEKWLPCVPFLQLSCVMYALWPIHTTNLQVINAVGRSDIYLKLEIIKKALGVISLIITVPMGIMPMMVGSCIVSIPSALINAYPNKNLLNYGYLEQIRDLLPIMFTTSIMSLIVLSIQLFNFSNWLTLIIQVIIGVTVYFMLSKILKLEGYLYVLQVIKSIKEQRA